MSLRFKFPFTPEYGGVNEMLKYVHSVFSHLCHLSYGEITQAYSIVGSVQLGTRIIGKCLVYMC